MSDDRDHDEPLSAGYSILIVDDDPSMVQALAATLRESGRLRFATSGQGALRLIGEHEPDLVLLDADMPGMDGFEVLRQIKLAPLTRDLRVIMVTGLTSEAHEKAGLELGAADFIAKPFRPSIVQARVRTQLSLKQVNDQLKALSVMDRQKLDHALVELKSRNDQLTETSGRLQLANRGLLQFIHAASHDLREPLNAVTQFAGLILEDSVKVSDLQSQQHLKRIIRAGERMKGLLDDAATYARLLSETQDQGTSVDLNLVLREVQDALEEPIRKSALSISCADLPTVHASTGKITQAIQNLLLNAIQYAHPERGAAVQISAHVQDGWARILFQDTGIGIDPQHWERVFDPFKRLHRRDAIAAKGLGLTMGRQIAESFGGSLTIVQSSAEGTTFCMTLRSVNT